MGLTIPIGFKRFFSQPCLASFISVVFVGVVLCDRLPHVVARNDADTTRLLDNFSTASSNTFRSVTLGSDVTAYVSDGGPIRAENLLRAGCTASVAARAAVVRRGGVNGPAQCTLFGVDPSRMTSSQLSEGRTDSNGVAVSFVADSGSGTLTHKVYCDDAAATGPDRTTANQMQLRAVSVKSGKAGGGSVQQNGGMGGLEVVWRSPLACSGANDADPPILTAGFGAAAAILSVLAVVIVLYCAIGSVYKWRTLGVTGVEVIPNIELWREIPGYLADLYAYVATKIRNSFGRSGYQELH